MHWNRFDICEAWYLYLSQYHEGQWSEKYARLCKLTRPGFFRPALNLNVAHLTDNGREIYESLVDPNQ